MMRIPTHEEKQEHDILVEWKHQPELHDAGAVQRLNNVRKCVCTWHLCLFILCGSSCPNNRDGCRRNCSLCRGDFIGSPGHEARPHLRLCLARAGTNCRSFCTSSPYAICLPLREDLQLLVPLDVGDSQVGRGFARAGNQARVTRALEIVH